MAKLTFKEILRKARDEGIKIEARAEASLKIIEGIVWKNKPSTDDINRLKEVIKLLKG